MYTVKSTLHKFKDLWPLVPAAIYLLFFFCIVFIHLFASAFDQTTSGIMIKKVIAMPDFRDALLNTTLFVAVGTPLELILGFFLAMLIYQSGGRLQSYLKGFFILPLAVPGLVLATLLFIIFDTQGGFINDIITGRYNFFPQIISSPIDWRGSKVSSLGLSLAGKIWRDIPISMLILLSGLNSIDITLLDAAKSMGAKLRHRIMYVIIPQIIPSISAVVFLRSIEIWKEFIFPYVLAGRYHLLGTLIESLYITWAGAKEAEASTVALLLVGVILLSILFYLVMVEITRFILIDRTVK